MISGWEGQRQWMGRVAEMRKVTRLMEIELQVCKIAFNWLVLFYSILSLYQSWTVTDGGIYHWLTSEVCGIYIPYAMANYSKSILAFNFFIFKFFLFFWYGIKKSLFWFIICVFCFAFFCVLLGRHMGSLIPVGVDLYLAVEICEEDFPYLCNNSKFQRQSWKCRNPEPASLRKSQSVTTRLLRVNSLCGNTVCGGVRGGFKL